MHRQSSTVLHIPVLHMRSAAWVQFSISIRTALMKIYLTSDQLLYATSVKKVACKLAKLKVEGSSPFFRFYLINVI